MVSTASLALSRRAAVRLASAGVAAALTARVGPVGAQDATPTTPFAGETFVGEAGDGETFVAIVVAEGDEDDRQARAYLCDADAIDMWLTGTANGNVLELADEAGTSLTAQLSDETVTGEVVLPDETSLAFEAAPATGIAGLYDVIVEPDATLQGVAATGSHLEGRIEAQAATPRSGVDAAFPYMAAVTITSEGEEPVSIPGTISIAAEGTFRMIVLEDGRSRGGGKSATGTVKWKSTTR